MLLVSEYALLIWKTENKRLIIFAPAATASMKSFSSLRSISRVSAGATSTPVQRGVGREEGEEDGKEDSFRCDVLKRWG